MPAAMKARCIPLQRCHEYRGGCRQNPSSGAAGSRHRRRPTRRLPTNRSAAADDLLMVPCAGELSTSTTQVCEYCRGFRNEVRVHATRRAQLYTFDCVLTCRGGAKGGSGASKHAGWTCKSRAPYGTEDAGVFMQSAALWSSSDHAARGIPAECARCATVELRGKARPASPAPPHGHRLHRLPDRDR